MNYKIIFFFISTIFVYGCEQSINKEYTKNVFIKQNSFKNSGFALVYNDNLNGVKKLENRSLNIYHKSLKKRSKIKISNPENGKYLIAEVKSNRVKFSDFYNSILSLRIAEELELNLQEPYVEIALISNNSIFVAKKSKTFEEERVVAEKAPVDGIQINDLNILKSKKKIVKNKKFSYSIKIADFYYKDTAFIMKDRIKNVTSIKKLKISRLSKTKYRVLIGPFNDIKSLKNSFEKLSSFNFENLEILKNE